MKDSIAPNAYMLPRKSACPGISVMQATLIYLAAPPEMRSRLYGVLSLCIGSGLVGFLHLGLMAELIGAPWATVLSAAEGLLVLAATWRWWRILLRRG